MKSELVYVLSHPIKQRLKTMGLDLNCCHCGEALKEGDEIVRKLSDTGTARRYHKECWESLHH